MINMYTDGACRGNPGVGGWGCLILSPNKTYGYGYETHTTNNRMEIMGVIEGFKQLISTGVSGKVVVHSDSNYVVKAMSSWRFGWAKKGWKNAQNKPVKNKELWLELIDLSGQFDVQWQWVKGHAGHQHNEFVDQLANQAIDEQEVGTWV